ncbi:MAG: ABC transporter permease [Cyclobacteriaceae bacterium]|nr:ABC transporter permease [Cyclobacteriaceae bacterium HetDA_MAG_MS6]
MNMLLLSWKNVVARPLSSALSILLIALGVGLISMIILLGSQIQEKFEQNMKGVDMVVGAKGSPLQLILSAVFQIDSPTGNIPISAVEQLTKNRLVANTIPLSYGDTFQGHRIVGTDSSYIGLFDAEVLHGRVWNTPMEVTLGAEVAERLDLDIGDQFLGAHGLQEGGEDHEEAAYSVVGILGRTNAVIDQLIVTDTESVWQVHHHEENQEGEREITALLVKFRSPMGLVTLPRKINQNTNLQAAVPAFEISRLVGLLGMGIDTVSVIGIIIIVMAGVSMFISLYSALNDRRYEMALMRCYGASAFKLVRLVINESLLVTIAGLMMGLVLSRLGVVIISAISESSYHYALDQLSIIPEELRLLAFTLLTGLVAAIIPAIQVYQVNISKNLSNS